MDDLLNHDRIKRAQRNYNKMKLSSVILASQKKIVHNEEQLAERGRQRMRKNEEIKKQRQLDWIASLKSQQGHTS